MARHVWKGRAPWSPRELWPSGAGGCPSFVKQATAKTGSQCRGTSMVHICSHSTKPSGSSRCSEDTFFTVRGMITSNVVAWIHSKLLFRSRSARFTDWSLKTLDFGVCWRNTWWFGMTCTNVRELSAWCVCLFEVFGCKRLRWAAVFAIVIFSCDCVPTGLDAQRRHVFLSDVHCQSFSERLRLEYRPHAHGLQPCLNEKKQPPP